VSSAPRHKTDSHFVSVRSVEHKPIPIHCVFQGFSQPLFGLFVNYSSAKASELPVSAISSCGHSENGFVEGEISTGVNFLCPGGIEN